MLHQMPGGSVLRTCGARDSRLPLLTMPWNSWRWNLMLACSMQRTRKFHSPSLQPLPSWTSDAVVRCGACGERFDESRPNRRNRIDSCRNSCRTPGSRRSGQQRSRNTLETTRRKWLRDFVFTVWEWQESRSPNFYVTPKSTGRVGPTLLSPVVLFTGERQKPGHPSPAVVNTATGPLFCRYCRDQW